MKTTTINLTEGFNPYPCHQEALIKKFNFPGGECHVKLPIYLSGRVIITSRVQNGDDIMMILLTVNAIRQSFHEHPRELIIELFIAYLPYARQDRVGVDGEPLSIKVMADILNSQNFSKVTFFDVHSDVSTALINNCVNTPNYQFVNSCIDKIYENKIPPSFIVSPDAGANKKSHQLMKYLYSSLRLLKCDKTRDVSTGKLSGFEVYAGDLDGKDCIIVDDICDGGGTFLGLAEELKKKNCGKLYLIVSHGIFSKGLKELSKTFEHIFTSDSFRDLSPSNDWVMRNEKYLDKLTQLPIKL